MKNQIIASSIAALLGTSMAAMCAGADPVATARADASASKSAASIDAAHLSRAEHKLSRAIQIADHFAQLVPSDIIQRARFEMINALMAKPERAFADIEARPSLQEAMLAAAAPATSDSGTTAKDLGDEGDDLTYIPLASPCRIVDTRLAGGALQPKTPRTFSFSATNSSQGGSGCSPYVGYEFQGAAGAAAINITAVFAPDAVIGSFVEAYPYGGSTTTSWLNFSGGQVVANEGILGISSYAFTLKSNTTVDTIVDVFGSFVTPHATTPECVVVGRTVGSTAVADVTLPAGTNTYLQTAACPASFVVQTPYCYTGGTAGVQLAGMGTFLGYVGPGGTAFCAFRNTTAADQTVQVGTTCCRIPGRTDQI